MLCAHYKSGCALGLYGAQPSPGVGARCPRRTFGRDDSPNTAHPAARPEDFFDAVYVLNLKRRPDRLEILQRRLAAARWPFARPEVVEAVDGQTLTPPENWGDSIGAWGIFLSHQSVLNLALARGQHSILVLEDDATFVESFAEKTLDWLARVPPNWDALMLGGQHCIFPARVSSDTTRCRATVCMHGYAIRGRLLRDLHQYLAQTQSYQCDWRFAELMARYHVYAPNPFLICQSADISDNTGKPTQALCWNDHWNLAPGPVLRALPPAQWPWHVQLIARLRTPQDRDVGETLSRVAGRAGRTLEEMFLFLTGWPCQCAQRRADWAILYPYPGKS